MRDAWSATAATCARLTSVSAPMSWTVSGASRTDTSPARPRPGMAGEPVSPRDQHRLLVLLGQDSAIKPVCRCYPLQCAEGHLWRPGTVTVSWLPCSCAGPGVMGHLRASLPGRRLPAGVAQAEAHHRRRD